MPQYLSPGVYVEEVEAGSRPIEGVGTSVAAFVGLAQRGPFNQPTQVTNWTQFVQAFGDFMDGSYLAHAVYGYFLNGGGTCFVVRIGANGAAPAARAELPLGRDKALPYRITALEAGPGGNDITVDIADASEPGDDVFKLIVKRGGKEAEVYDNVTTKKGRRNVVTAVKTQSKLIQLEEIPGATAMEPVSQGHTALAGGGASAPVRVTPDAYVGNSNDRTGFGGLEAVDTVTMLAVPDLMAAYQAGVIDLEAVQAVQGAMIAHCELLGDRPGLAVHQRPPALQLHRGIDPRRHAVGRVRAERHGPVGAGQADDQFVPGPRLAGWRPVRRDPAGGLLRQVRLGDEPRRGDRRREADRRGRHRTRQARRVCRFPHRPVLGRRITGRIGGIGKCQAVCQDLRPTRSPVITSRSKWTASPWPSSRRSVGSLPSSTSSSSRRTPRTASTSSTSCRATASRPRSPSSGRRAPRWTSGNGTRRSTRATSRRRARTGPSSSTTTRTRRSPASTSSTRGLPRSRPAR